MSAVEVATFFQFQLPPELAADLDEQLKAADKAVTVKGVQLPRTSKIALVSFGTTLYASFLLGPSGSGPCTAKGTGAFNGHVSPPELAGNYTLDVDELTIKLYESSGRLIWKGLGAQKGLTGKWNIEF